MIRNYHGHLSGVYSLAQHPTVDILMTGGRDAGRLVASFKHVTLLMDPRQEVWCAWLCMTVQAIPPLSVLDGVHNPAGMDLAWLSAAKLLLVLFLFFFAACRVWDIRTKVQVHCLSGHEDTVAAILAMPTDPQVSFHCWSCMKQAADWVKQRSRCTSRFDAR